MKKLLIATIAALSLPAAACLPAMAQQGQGSQHPQASQLQHRHNAAIHLNKKQVRKLQQALNTKGFQAGRVDGKMGPKTHSALRNFEQKQGMQQANGRVNNQALSALGIEGAQQNASRYRQNGMNAAQQSQSMQQSGSSSNAMANYQNTQKTKRGQNAQHASNQTANGHNANNQNPSK